jgi:hypothetical protein
LQKQEIDDVGNVDWNFFIDLTLSVRGIPELIKKDPRNLGFKIDNESANYTENFKTFKV